MHRVCLWLWLGCVCGACIDTEAGPLPLTVATDAGASERDEGRQRPPTAPVRMQQATGGSAPEPDAGAAPLGMSAVTAGSPATPGRVDAAGAPAPRDASIPVVPAPSRAGQLVITELMIDPATLSDTQGEWIELHNTTRESFELRGCELDDGGKTPHLIQVSLPIAPGAYLTIARQAQPGFKPSHIAAISLTNGADSVALRCAGREIDRVLYDQTFPLSPGASLALDPEHVNERDNDRAGCWCSGRDAYGPELGSPGAPNPPCADGEEADAGVH